jgi:Domain of unknown function (DUF222)
MGWQPGTGSGAGASPDRDPRRPHARDPRLAWFASDTDGCDALIPSGLLALAADEVAGPERRCPGASPDELVGLARAFAAVESWAAGGKLGVIAEMIRRDDDPRKGYCGSQREEHGRHGDLPDDWSPSLRHELALALACSVQSAQTTLWLAWEKQARLPGTGALLDDGTLTLGKARAVTETFKYLTDADAAAAEALILDQLAGKTYPQVLRLAEQAALTVDPGLAERRREETQRRNARVTFFREMSGTAGVSGRDLPPDDALAAMAGVTARAQQYADSGAFGDLPADALRAYAFVDLLKGTPAEDRLSCAEAQDEDTDIAEALAWADARAARNAVQRQTEHPGDGPEPAAGPPADPDSGRPSKPAAGNGRADEQDASDSSRGGRGDACPPDRDDPAAERDDGRDDDGPDNGSGDGPAPGGPGASPAGRAVQPRPPDLVVPLLTLLGLAERPGEIQGFGLLDPALARSLAAAADASPRTEVCVTVTSPEGYAVGHGCAYRNAASGQQDRPARAALASVAGLTARLNLTIPAAALTGLASTADSTGGTGSWSFAPRAGTRPPGGTDPPDGYGTWELILPGGRRLIVPLETVPTESCEHRYESRGYHPSEKLRHLVQVRDGTCTFPSCNRHARDSDFEHAIPFGKGGRTCACNAGARSRACHRVKQTEGWAVQQPHPGWHQWTTPGGRVYTQGPKRYPA